MARTGEGWMTYLTDYLNGEDTNIDFRKEDQCVAVYFGSDEMPAFLIDSVDGVIRVCIYEDDDPDSEPTIHETRIISGTY